MNRLLWLVVVLLLIWIIKLSVHIYGLENQQLHSLSNHQDQQNQRIATLYDQIVAIQEQQEKLATQAVKQSKSQASVSHVALPANVEQEQQRYISDRLALIQANLQQQRSGVALEQLQALRQKLVEEQPLPESLNTALIEALLRDQNSITLYLQQRNEHQQILQQQLHGIAQKLQPVMLDSKQNKWQWSSWLSFGRAEQIPDMQNRVFHYKELQLRLLLAQQALYAGQQAFYRAQLKDTIVALSAYPDRDTHQIVGNLQKLETMSLIATPQLSALALVQQE
ncbi:hypothetical protein GWI33_009985 [Rhynchophorus ferrugineus]|uniref:Uncharacterized protein n=1 Tax=Rhynchophorus ferrugineus TaxID=354439 RepID=A0A834MAG8_RHYFE|nr:hypothetical protein GWI33_009985 [Rhynchophorus ferrugineus]